jgi:hypothetical protein
MGIVKEIMTMDVAIVAHIRGAAQEIYSEEP